MSISEINEILVENLEIDLEWLKEEFEILLDSKMIFLITFSRILM